MQYARVLIHAVLDKTKGGLRRKHHFDKIYDVLLISNMSVAKNSVSLPQPNFKISPPNPHIGFFGQNHPPNLCFV